MACPARPRTQRAPRPTSSWRSSATFSSACAAQYVTPPDEKALVENAINGMLTSLDPHSSYLNPEAAKDMRVQTKGEFGGLGIEVTMENELVKVITPIDDTPAAKAGVLRRRLHFRDRRRGGARPDAQRRGREDARPGQHADQADDPARGRRQADRDHGRARHHQGEGGQVPRRERRRLHEDHLVHREDLRRPRQPRSTTIKKQVPADKLKGYVLDLRLNPGGLLDQAVSVSDAFLDRGEIVSTRGRDPKDISPLRRAAGRHDRRQAADRAGQWRFGERFGDRRRRAAGPSPRHRRRHAVLRQGLGADDHPARRERRAAPDDGALLHAVRQVDPGQGHHARHQGRPAAAGRAARAAT